MNGGVGVCTKATGLQGSYLKPLCCKDTNISFLAFLFTLLPCVLVVAQPDLPPLLWNVESRSGIGIELQAPLSLGAWILKHWTFGKDPTLLTFGVNVHMQVHVQRRLLNQYCSVLSFCSTVYVK